MLRIQRRVARGGAVIATPFSFPVNSLSGRALAGLSLLLMLLWAFAADGATVSGTVTMPVSDGGYRPTIAAWKPPAVRVMGTSLQADVVVTSQYSGSFTLTGVPPGPVTLLYVETAGEDNFTLDSRRRALTVTGDVAGVAFDLVHHWKNLPSYPPPWRDPKYDIWEPYWVSAKVGFILFLNRGASPHETELWRTTSGGLKWTLVGHWVHAAGSVHPDITGRSMLFANAYDGVITAGTSVNFGMLRTTDGGASWTVIDLPNTPGTNGIASVQNYARIDATHWIACGPENTGTYMGSGTPTVFTVWETADAGATWAIRRTWNENYAGCSAVDADKSGKAVLFSTPYAFGGGMHRELRNAAGAWEPVAGNNIVTNSGYGTADLPMVGDVVWVRASSESPTGAGLFQSTDAGATFSKISSVLPQYMDFASTYKGMGPAGGPMYATYDGGVTWLYQSAGGGICCHGNYIWVFDTMHAVWREGGVGDPNGTADIFSYEEPRTASFEVMPGVAIVPASAAAGDVDVPVLSLRFVNHGPMPLELSGLELRGSGTGNELLDVAAVKAWLDRDANGVVDPADPVLASGSYTSDNGIVTLELGSTHAMQPLLPYHVLVTYDFAGYVAAGGRFAATAVPATITAESADSGATLTVAATAPAGTQITSGQATVAPSTVRLSGVSLSSALVSGCKSVSGTVQLTEPAPAAGLLVYLSDTLDSVSVPATVSVPAGATSKSFTAKTTPVAANQGGSVKATLGSTTLGANLTVRPMQLFSVSLSPVAVVGGQTLSGTAKLECAAGPGPITVSLASSDAGVAAPTAPSIVVPTGSTAGAFLVSTRAVTAKTSVSITASANGLAKSKTLTLNTAAAVSPTSLKFGGVPVGTTSAALTTTLSNKGSAPFAVVDIGLAGSYATWYAQTNDCPASLAAGAHCTIRVVFKPQAAATRLAKLVVATSATAQPISVSLSGTGL